VVKAYGLIKKQVRLGGRDAKEVPLLVSGGTGRRAYKVWLWRERGHEYVETRAGEKTSIIVEAHWEAVSAEAYAGEIMSVQRRELTTTPPRSLRKRRRRRRLTG
jgi:hypothetical protein